jgi:hypothetical protein
VDAASDFQHAEVSGPTEADAATEARRRQAQEADPNSVEWIYLRNRDGVWVARRTLRDGSSEVSKQDWTKRTLIGRFLSALVQWSPW